MVAKYDLLFVHESPAEIVFLTQEEEKAHLLLFFTIDFLSSAASHEVAGAFFAACSPGVGLGDRHPTSRTDEFAYRVCKCISVLFFTFFKCMGWPRSRSRTVGRS